MPLKATGAGAAFPHARDAGAAPALPPAGRRPAGQAAPKPEAPAKGRAGGARGAPLASPHDARGAPLASPRDSRALLHLRAGRRRGAAPRRPGQSRLLPGGRPFPPHGARPYRRRASRHLPAARRRPRPWGGEDGAGAPGGAGPRPQRWRLLARSGGTRPVAPGARAWPRVPPTPRSPGAATPDPTRPGRNSLGEGRGPGHVSSGRDGQRQRWRATGARPCPRPPFASPRRAPGDGLAPAPCWSPAASPGRGGGLPGRTGPAAGAAGGGARVRVRPRAALVPPGCPPPPPGARRGEAGGAPGPAAARWKG